MSAPKNQWYHKKIEFDSMSVEELVEFFKDKQFFMYDCNDPQWNNAILRLREVHGPICPDPKTGFGVVQ